MSEQAGGNGCDDKQVEEEGQVFLSGKSYSIINAKNNQSSFMDDELVTWLQYPLDDDTCPDIFQHWPPASPAPVTAFTPSPANLKDLSQQENDVFMANVASGRSLQDVDGSTTPRADETGSILLKQASHHDATTADLKRGESVAQEGSPRFEHHGNEPTSTVDALRLAGPHVDERQDTSRNCKSLAKPKTLSQEGPRIWEATEALSSHSKHKLAEKKIVMAETMKMANTQLKCLPQLHVGDSSSQYGVHREPAQANTAADAALALGAGRAAGSIRASGLEAFSKVRTSSQSLLSSKLGTSPLAFTPPSPSGKGSDGSSSPTMLPPRARPVGFHPVILSNQQSYPLKLPTVAQPTPVRPSTKIPDIVSQERPSVTPLKGVSTSNENSSKESPLQSSMTASAGSQGLKQVEEGVNICSTSNRVATLQRLDSADMQKLSGTSSPRRERREAVALSGDSETSESLRETLSGSKRKMEDSECQSELQDAEGESAVNSQTRTSSKRTRANEVHNLSERRRRNRINDKMNALRELIPNASKTNKAALLDEAIEYLKNLQLQLQVMSVRTGMNLSPMVVPPGLPHMQAPQGSPLYPVGIGTLGGSSTGVVSAGSAMGVAMCNMTYGVPARPPNPRIIQPAERSSLNQLHQPLPTPESVSLHYPHSFVQNPSQSMFSVNMDMCNTYLQQQHLQHQQLQQHVHHQEQQASSQVQTPSPPSPAPQHQPHYQL